jgi:hypothetical protein
MAPSMTPSIIPSRAPTLAPSIRRPTFTPITYYWLEEASVKNAGVEKASEDEDEDESAATTVIGSSYSGLPTILIIGTTLFAL